MLDVLGSHKLGVVLGFAGLLYGIMGVTYLHVAADGVLVVGAAMILAYTFTRKWNRAARQLVHGG